MNPLSLFFNTAKRGPRESAPPREFAPWGAEKGLTQLVSEDNFRPAYHNTRTLRPPTRLVDYG